MTDQQKKALQELESYIRIYKIGRSIRMINEVLPETFSEQDLEGLATYLEDSWQPHITYLMNILADFSFDEACDFGENVYKFTQDGDLRTKALIDIGEYGNISDPLNSFVSGTKDPKGEHPPVNGSFVPCNANNPLDDCYDALDKSAFILGCMKYFSYAEMLFNEQFPEADGSAKDTLDNMKGSLITSWGSAEDDVVEKLAALDTLPGTEADRIKEDRGYRIDTVAKIAKAERPARDVVDLQKTEDAS